MVDDAGWPETDTVECYLKILQEGVGPEVRGCATQCQYWFQQDGTEARRAMGRVGGSSPSNGSLCFCSEYNLKSHLNLIEFL